MSKTTDKTIRPPKHSTPPEAHQRATGEKRQRINTNVQRVVLEELLEGPRKPRTVFRTRTYEALEKQGLTFLQSDGKYIITQRGIEVLRGQLGGRPSKFTGAWADLVSHYGGLKTFADLVPTSENSVRRWALHGVVPIQELVLNRIVEMSLAAKLPNPFLQDPS